MIVAISDQFRDHVTVSEHRDGTTRAKETASAVDSQVVVRGNVLWLQRSVRGNLTLGIGGADHLAHL